MNTGRQPKIGKNSVLLRIIAKNDAFMSIYNLALNQRADNLSTLNIDLYACDISLTESKMTAKIIMT